MASAVRGGRTRTRITTSRTSKFMSGNSDLSEFKTGLSEHLQKSIETKTFAATDAAPGAGADLIEVALEDYDATVADLSGDGKVLVMDFYTQWCGPCKLMKPTLVEWSESMASQGVSFRTFEASKKNAPVASSLRAFSFGVVASSWSFLMNLGVMAFWCFVDGSLLVWPRRWR